MVDYLKRAQSQLDARKSEEAKHQLRQRRLLVKGAIAVAVAVPVVVGALWWLVRRSQDRLFFALLTKAVRNSPAIDQHIGEVTSIAIIRDAISDGAYPFRVEGTKNSGTATLTEFRKVRGRVEIAGTLKLDSGQIYPL
jgi:hypothetical protein